MGNGVEFFQTGMGKRFYEFTMPKLIESLDSLTAEMKRANDLKEKEMSSPIVVSSEVKKEEVKDEFSKEDLDGFFLDTFVQDDMSDIE
jgi:hypothetical protein